MLVLTQFILRLSLGMAAAMATVSPRLVTSGYYRNNLYVLLGLNVLAALVAWTARADISLWIAPPAATAIVCYAGVIAWLYQRPTAGIGLLWGVAGLSALSCWLDTPAVVHTGASRLLTMLDPLGGGLVLGLTMSAMLLGHWYLNSPGMQIAPLKRLVLLLIAAVVVRALISGSGLAATMALGEAGNLHWWLFVLLRWLSGVVGTLLVAIMTWKTLEIPNTQSATGILYVGVLATFLGELTAQLLSRDSVYPL